MIRGQYLMTIAGPERAPGEVSFGYLIQRLAKEIDARMKAELKAIDVDFKLFANLLALMKEDGINQRRLGETLGFPEYFTSRNVDAMVQAGFAERQPDPQSRRSFLVFLTPKGRRKAELLPPIIKAVNDESLASLSDAERKTVVELLQKTIASPGGPAG